jgi:hypothetical protein
MVWMYCLAGGKFVSYTYCAQQSVVILYLYGTRLQLKKTRTNVVCLGFVVLRMQPLIAFSQLFVVAAAFCHNCGKSIVSQFYTLTFVAATFCHNLSFVASAFYPNSILCLLWLLNSATIHLLLAMYFALIYYLSVVANALLHNFSFVASLFCLKLNCCGLSSLPCVR